MAISFSTVTSALRRFSGKPLGVMSQALGVASVASVIYDSHVNGKEKAVVTDDLESADRFETQYNNYRKSDKQSATVAKLKHGWFDFQQNMSYYHPISKVKGYSNGFVSTLVRELPVVALSAVSICCKNVVGKCAGVLLALNAGKTLLCDVLGMGSKKATIKNLKCY